MSTDNPGSKTLILTATTLWLLVAALVAGLAYCIFLFSQSRLPIFTERQLGRLPVDQELLFRLSSAERQIRDLQHMISVIGGLASLFGLVVGVGAFLGLRQMLETSRHELAEMQRIREQAARDARDLTADQKSRLASLQQEIAASFPLVGNVETSLRRLLVELRKRFRPDTDWLSTFYRSHSPDERVAVEMAELRQWEDAEGEQLLAGARKVVEDLEQAKAVADDIQKQELREWIRDERQPGQDLYLLAHPTVASEFGERIGKLET